MDRRVVEEHFGNCRSNVLAFIDNSLWRLPGRCLTIAATSRKSFCLNGFWGAVAAARLVFRSARRFPAQVVWRCLKRMIVTLQAITSCAEYCVPSVDAERR